MKPTRIGLAGLGHVAPYHVKAIEAESSLRLVAACDIDPMTHHSVGVPVYADVDALLREERPDAMVVAVPPAHHEAVASAALERGVDVLVEKPTVLSLDSFDRLAAMADRAGAIFYASFHFAFGREVVWFLDRRKTIEGETGPVTAIRCCFYDPYVTGGRVADRAQHLYGSWADSGSNALSVLAALVDDYAVVDARLTSLAGYDRDVAAEYSLSFRGSGSKGMAVITTSWCTGENRKRTLLHHALTGTWIELDHNRERVVTWRDAGTREVIFEGRAPTDHLLAHYRGVYRDFVKAREQRVDNRERARRLTASLWESPEYQ